MTTPPIVAPGATPATSAGVHDRHALGEPRRGTVRSVSDSVAISVGAMAKPPSSSTRPISGTEPTKYQRQPSRPSRTRPTDPDGRAAAPLDRPRSPARRPGCRAPRARAAAGVRLAALLLRERHRRHLRGPEQDAERRRTTASGTTVRHGIGGAVPARDRRGGWAGGSVARWAQNASVPTTPASTSDRGRPATGSHAVASTVTRIGPSMKTASSTTASIAYAVWTSAGSPRTCDHRARTQEPIWGSEPPGHRGRDVGGQDRPVGLHRRSRAAPWTARRRRSPWAAPAPGRGRSTSRPWRIASRRWPPCTPPRRRRRGRRSRWPRRPAGRCRGPPSRSAAGPRDRPR